MPLHDLTSQKAAAVLAHDVLIDVTRLREMEEVRGQSLTDNQSADLGKAVDQWNSAADVIGLPHLTTDTSFAVVRGFGDALKDTVRALAMREDPRVAALIYGAAMDPTSGLSFGGTDEIRSMLTSGERQHDFTFLESDQIRSLPWPSDDESEVRAISDFANGASLYVSDFAKRVAMYARTESPWIGLGSVFISSNGRPLVVPTLTGDVTVYTPGEGTAITASDPTLGTVTVSPTGFKALTYVSRESFDDEDVNLTDVLARSHARAIGLAFGSTATTAVLAGINNGGTASGIGGNGTATATFYGYEDLIDLKYGRAAPYRQNGAWVMANAGLKKTRKFKDQQGQYLWPGGGFSGGQPQTFDGNAAWEDPNLASPASATKSVVYGDFAAALAIKATPMRVEVSTDFLFDKDQIAIKTVQRIALAVQDPAAAAYLVSANT